MDRSKRLSPLASLISHCVITHSGIKAVPFILATRQFSILIKFQEDEEEEIKHEASDCTETNQQQRCHCNLIGIFSIRARSHTRAVMEN